MIWFSKSSNLPRVMRSPQARTPASATWNISHNICQKFVSNSTHLTIPLDNLNQVFQIISHTPHLKIPFLIVVLLQNHFNHDFNTLSSCSWSSTITKLARLCSTTYRTASGLFVVYMPEKKLFVISAVSVYWQNPKTDSRPFSCESCFVSWNFVCLVFVYLKRVDQFGIYIGQRLNCTLFLAIVDITFTFYPTQLK